ncbi:hypothetical protein PF005_g2077, partial [Phytophthora fragariae]
MHMSFRRRRKEIKTQCSTAQVHEESVCAACESEGYRHIDTAVYRNEADVGLAIRDSGAPRQEVFVTSKIVAPRGRCRWWRACGSATGSSGS